ncbi:MAG: hypothetical protein DDT27_00833 [Dehalococcoidia bacterium]|nr:hypothetical protein [Chloroflexota bacterium]MBT9162282.1 hypothetical protein [Chloroflexota bacterium]
MAKEMKDRHFSQTSIVEASCRKQFPAHPKFLNPSAVGTLSCRYPTNPGGLSVAVGVSTIEFVGLTFEVQQRTRELVRAVRQEGSPDQPIPKGTTLTIHFERGEALLSFPGEKPSSMNLDCAP